MMDGISHSGTKKATPGAKRTLPAPSEAVHISKPTTDAASAGSVSTTALSVSATASSTAADIDQLRLQSLNRLKTAWEALFEKYGQDFGDEDDEIDLTTGKIVVDRGKLRETPGPVFFGTFTSGPSGEDGSEEKSDSDGSKKRKRFLPTSSGHSVPSRKKATKASNGKDTASPDHARTSIFSQWDSLQPLSRFPCPRTPSSRQAFVLSDPANRFAFSSPARPLNRQKFDSFSESIEVSDDDVPDDDLWGLDSSLPSSWAPKRPAASSPPMDADFEITEEGDELLSALGWQATSSSPPKAVKADRPPSPKKRPKNPKKPAGDSNKNQEELDAVVDSGSPLRPEATNSKTNFVLVLDDIEEEPEEAEHVRPSRDDVPVDLVEALENDAPAFLEEPIEQQPVEEKEEPLASLIEEASDQTDLKGNEQPLLLEVDAGLDNNVHGEQPLLSEGDAGLGNTVHDGDEDDNSTTTLRMTTPEASPPVVPGPVTFHSCSTFSIPGFSVVLPEIEETLPPPGRGAGAGELLKRSTNLITLLVKELTTECDDSRLASGYSASSSIEEEYEEDEGDEEDVRPGHVGLTGYVSCPELHDVQAEIAQGGDDKFLEE
ncbi:hypothetical protein HDU96_001404 [Phlyctochytrium bullatum]|nr:hypothetical protein HDU96_001404 [Phlyctochytrium bullatum]